MCIYGRWTGRCVETNATRVHDGVLQVYAGSAHGEIFIWDIDVSIFSINRRKFSRTTGANGRAVLFSKCGTVVSVRVCVFDVIIRHDYFVGTEKDYKAKRYTNSMHSRR
jgi:hypothetical protein